MRPLHRGVLLVACATVAALYFSTQAFLNPLLRDKVTLRGVLTVNLAYYLLWALAAPAVFRLARRVPFERARWWRAVAAHTGGSVALTSAIIVLAEVALVASGERPPSWPPRLGFAFAVNFHSLLPTYWMLLLGWLAFDFYAQVRDRELRAAQLEARLHEARLAALKAQVQPHFLFNTLNSISSLMYQDVDAADAMLTRLSELLRLTIDRDRQLVPLREELEIVRRYLDIERVRFEERLSVEYDVEPGLEEVLVPSLVLQPLVENAVRHSIAPREGGGRIRIAAARHGDRMEIEVADDGPGPSEGAAARRGVGLGNTEARLLQLYGDRSGLTLARPAQGGFAVRVPIPLEKTA